MRARFLHAWILPLFLAAPWSVDVSVAATTEVEDVRLWSGPEGTRFVIEMSTPARYEVFTLDDPARVVVDLDRTRLAMRQPLPAGQGPVRSVRSGPQAGGGLRIVLDLTRAQAVNAFIVPADDTEGHRLVVELPAAGAPVPEARGLPVGAPPAQAPPAASPPSGPLSSQVLAASSQAVAREAVAVTNPVKTVAAGAAARGRDLVIAIDAGHGGQDPGAIGRGGTREKDVTLAIARKLARAIDAEDGMRAVLIREGDYFVSLRNRVRKAREQRADMFVSVHADSVLNRGVNGSSVYVLSLRGASDEAARWLAERENAADLMGGVSLDDKNDVLASVLLDVTQKEAVSNSVDAASSVLDAMRRVGDVHRPRVQHAGFAVLKSPDIPSMLVETAFISNASDERKLRDSTHQQRLAGAIFEGIRNYFYEKPPPGTRVAAIVAARDGAAAAPRTLAER
jgi:N-acetylmuramoyl-L-alanine amidase